MLNEDYNPSVDDFGGTVMVWQKWLSGGDGVQASKRSSIRGMNLPEMSLTLAVLGVISSVAAPAFTVGRHSLEDTMNLLEGNFKLARSKSMSQTKAYRIRPDGSDRFVMERHEAGVGSSIYSCADAEVSQDGNGNAIWSKSAGFNVDEDMALQDGVRLKSVTVDGVAIADLSNWSLCFDSRGMAHRNIILTLEKSETGDTRSLEVFSGGSLVSYDSTRYQTGSSSPSGSNDSLSNGSHNNNGHGNNCDGSDVSNPSDVSGGYDASGSIDDECVN